MDSTDMRSHILNQGTSALKTLELNKEKVENFCAPAEFDRIILNGAGDKYLVCLTASYLWREHGREPLTVVHSRDLADNPPHMDENTLVIFVSQSGKTKDTMDAAREAVKRKAQTLVVTNLREASDESLWFLKKHGGEVLTTFTDIYPEKSLPSTMTFQSTLSLLWHLLSELSGKDMFNELVKSAKLTDKLAKSPETEKTAKAMAEKLSKEFPARYVMGDGPRYGLARKLGLIMFMEGVKANAFALETEEFLHSAIETLEEENKSKLSNTIFMPPKTATFRKTAEKISKFWKEFAPVHEIPCPDGIQDALTSQAQMVLPIWASYHEALMRGVDPGVSRLVNKVRTGGF